MINPNHPKSSKGHFLEKISTVGNWYVHLFKWGKITTWQEVQAISAEYDRPTKMHGKGMFPKVHWRILEVPRARIPRVNRMLEMIEGWMILRELLLFLKIKHLNFQTGFLFQNDDTLVHKSWV